MVLGIKNPLKRDKDLMQISERLILENIQLKKELNLNIEKILPSLEALDQDKIYLMTLKREGDRQAFGNMYPLLKKQVKWTLPTILVSAHPLEELKESELKSLLAKIKKK